MSTGKKRGPTAEQLASGLIISVKETRRVLGEAAVDLNDLEIAELILDLQELAHTLLSPGSKS